MEMYKKCGNGVQSDYSVYSYFDTYAYLGYNIAIY